MIGNHIDDYFRVLHESIRSAMYTERLGAGLGVDEAFSRLASMVRAAASGDNKLIFVGNGGSAGIASHAAIDYSKNGGMRALAFNDGAALTCLANDLGYDHVFSYQIGLHGRRGDVLFAISSSGRSNSILNAVRAGRERDCAVVTFSGFDRDNPLREAGDLNCYVSSHEYGFVEVAHLALIHALLDLTTAGVLFPRSEGRDGRTGK